MAYSRREFGKLALAGLPAAALIGEAHPLFAAVATQAKPNSVISGVKIGTITYSYGSMPDQSAEATLRYIVESGISQVELMGNVVTSYAYRETGFTPPAGGGRGGGGAARGAGAPGAPGAAAPGARPGGPGAAPAGGGGGRAGEVAFGSWNNQPCPAGRGGPGGGAAGAPGAAAPAPGAGAAAAAAPRGGGGGRGGAPAAPLTPEQQAAAAEQMKNWRKNVSADVFKKLRKMYSDAGVTIYAVKNLSVTASDEEMEFNFNVAELLGADHVTTELPVGPTAAENLKRVGDYALKRKIYAAYHTHTQGSMTAFDEAFAASKGNKANVDLGHFVAGGNKGGTPMDFLNKFHDRVGSFHLKDRTLPEHCALNLAWGTGETPIKEILQLVKKNKWTVPATIELEYSIPQGSTAPQEVRKCLEYCRAALA